MPVLDKKLTETVARSLRGPETESEKKAGYVVHWCPSTPGFGLRVSRTGDRAYIAERRVDGKTKRRTLGKAVGAKAISIDAARKLQITVSSELQSGVDRAEVKRVQRKVDKQESVTLADAVRTYVKGKRRGKDGLPLKQRTQDDYTKMIDGGGTRLDGKPYANGILFALAAKPLHKITADDMREVYKTASARGKRQGVYGMQVLRAVLNWHGVAVEGSPLAKTTAGKDRIILSSTAGDPQPIPPENLGAWWRAAVTMAGGSAADGCRFILLTGCRPGEVFGDEYEDGLTVEKVDLKGGRALFPDTKNRKDHTVVLSAQALGILKTHCKGKKAGDKVFDVIDPGKTLDNINELAGIERITPHKLRHTFASVADELVSGYALKRMVNHTDAADVTGNNYVGKSENQLRRAWQTVADFIEECAQDAQTDIS